MKRFILFFNCLVLVFKTVLLAQNNGSIAGTILDEATNEPLPSVNILIKGTTIGGSTDVNGSFVVQSVPRGVYTIVVSLVGHITSEVAQIHIENGPVNIGTIKLRDAGVLMNEVVIYGASLKSERITDAPAAVSVIEARDIQLNSGSGQLPKLLETQPGVDIAQNGLNDFNINTRGFNSSLNRRLLVLLDGRDLAVAFLGSQEWNGLSVPIEDLGRMELIRGPASALYGANAFNGVINIQTPKPKEISGGKLTLAGGERNTLRSDLRYAATTGSLSYKINLGRFQGDTFSESRLIYPFEYQGLNPFLNTEVVPLDRSKVASTYGSARIDLDYKENRYSTIEVGLTQVENEVLVTGIGRVQVPKAIKPWMRTSFTSEKLYFQFWGVGRKSNEPQVSLSTGLPLDEQSFISQLDVQYRSTAMSDRLFIILGASQKYQFVDTKGTLTLAAHHDNISGVYGHLEYRATNWLKAVAAARWDRSTLHENQISPKIAFVWTPRAEHSFRATFNKAFQSPNYSELFLYVKHPFRNLAYFGNDNLIVEKITGYEIGYKGVLAEAFFITVDGYYNELKDFITDLAPAVNPKYPGQVTLPGETNLRTIWSYGNAGKVNEQGLEVGLNYYASNQIEINANYSFFDFEVIEKNPNDILLPNAPKHKMNGGITYKNPVGFDIALAIKYVPSFDWAAGIYQGKILEYTLVSLAASYKVWGNVQLGLNVTNLLDREHYQIFGGSLIRRRAIGTMTVVF